MTNMQRLEGLIADLPETHRVDVEGWDGEPTFRVNNKVFVFADPDATQITVKLPKDEAAAIVAGDDRATATGYGLGRAGWIDVRIGKRPTAAQWVEIEEWVRTSYTLVAPKKLARQVLDADGIA